MKTLFLSASVLAMTFMACGNKPNSSQETSSTADSLAVESTPSLVGKWDIENVVVNDSVYARPSEIDPDVRQSMVFNADSTYFISTNCNSISGPYTQKGLSLKMGDGAMTEMACHDMQVEDLLRRILPEISAVEFENDSVARLTTSSSMYVVLHKASASAE